MVGVKGRSGGPRPGAGRPKKTNEETLFNRVTPHQKPKVRIINPRTKDRNLGFENLSKMPGVTIKETSTYRPRQKR